MVGDQIRMRAIIALSAALLASACQTSDGGKSLVNYPEARALMDCVIQKSASYASQPDSALDLAAIAVGACSSATYAYENAVRRDHSRHLTDLYMREIAQSNLKFAAETIVEIRKRNGR